MDLPECIWVLVVAMLQPIDKLSVARTCHTLRNVVIRSLQRAVIEPAHTGNAIKLNGSSVLYPMDFIKQLTGVRTATICGTANIAECVQNMSRLCNLAIRSTPKELASALRHVPATVRSLTIVVDNLKPVCAVLEGATRQQSLDALRIDLHNAQV